MSKYYAVKFGSTWLTHDGTETGRPCKVSVENVGALVGSDRGNVSISADGTSFREVPLTPNGAGRVFSIVVAFMTTDVYDDVKGALDSSAASGTPINITGTGTPGNFDVDANVYDNAGSEGYLSWQSFNSNILRDVRINLITDAIN